MMDESSPRPAALAEEAAREIAEKKIKFKRQLRRRRSLHGGNRPGLCYNSRTHAHVFQKKEET